MNYAQILEERKPYFYKWKSLKGAIVYYRFKSGQIILFKLEESNFNDNLFTIFYNGVDINAKDIKIADSDIIKEYVKQEEQKHLNAIKKLKEEYKYYLK